MEIREGSRHTFCFRVEIITNLTILFVSLYFKVPQRYESMPTVCLKTRPPMVANMLSIKNSSMLMISVSDIVLVESQCRFFILQNKICPFLAQGICIYVDHSSL